MWMNEHEVEEAVRRFDDETPNLKEGAQVLDRLVRWTNNNSDGWPYWPKPARAANSLMGLLHGADRFDPTDITARQLAVALRPIKAFLTRQGVEHDQVFRKDEPTPAPTTPTATEEAERLLSYWERHGDNPEAVAKWAVQDMLGLARLVAAQS